MVYDDTLDSVLRPSWLALAALLFARIDNTRRKADMAKLARRDNDVPDANASGETAEFASAGTGDILDDIAGRDTTGTATVSPRLRLAVLRLCAALGDVGQLAGLVQPASLTMIEGIPPDLLAEVLHLVHADLLPLAGSFRKRGRSKDAGLHMQAAVVAPFVSGSDVSEMERKKFDVRVIAVLESGKPALFMLPFGMSPSRTLLDCAPRRVVLPAIDRAMLMSYWSATEPRLTKLHAREIVAVLPSDEHLATLSEAALLGALRLGDPRQAAEAIAARCEKPAGPRLDDLPDTPAKRAAAALITGLVDWRDGRADWNEVEHSLLLFGPSGTGKSYIAQAMASMPGIRFVRGSFAEWQAAGHLGDMLKAMRTSFAEAGAAAPAILFIDEIDSAGSRFSDERQNRGYQRQVINAFLLAVDQLNAAGGVVLVGACNDRAALDPAILRPGRFDKHIEVPLPGREALAAVLSAGLGEALGDAEIKRLSRRLLGSSLATAGSAIRAAKSAARHANRTVTVADVEAALPQAQTSPAVDWRVALHEAGHAIVANHFAPGSVERISIGNGTGTTEQLATASEGREEDFNRKIVVLMAGRAAERLCLGTVSSGAGGSDQSDLAQATTLAVAMERHLGLGETGPVWLRDTDLSDPTLIQRVRTKIERSEAEATAILSDRMSSLQAIAEVLVQERELDNAFLDHLLLGSKK